MSCPVKMFDQPKSKINYSNLHNKIQKKTAKNRQGSDVAFKLSKIFTNIFLLNPVENHGDKIKGHLYSENFGGFRKGK